MFFLPTAILFIFCVWCFFLVFFYLLFPVQVIALKDLSPKWPIICRAWRETLLTHLP